MVDCNIYLNVGLTIAILGIGEEEAAGDIALSSAVASFGIRWRSSTRSFDIAYANRYLEPTQANQFQWHVNAKKIEIFKTLAKPAEIKRLNKSIKLIPKDGVFHISKFIEAPTPYLATSPAVDLVTFHEQDESHHEQKQELKRKYGVIEESNNEDVVYSSTDD
ncbi:unnamed protein product [Rotaria socialis]|uniref:Uncharacterized protein n=1 Tax=Rotaria socialis TaxID=392032 RepID=A0A818F3Z4_9BILA|nr:unnamed protein product [Rotaria socialis]